MKKRKDQLGRNTILSLKYFSGAFYYLDRGYSSLNIHEKITVRTIFCGKNHPSEELHKYITNL